MNQHALSADLLQGGYKQSEFGKVILPFTVLRRLDCGMEPTKDEVQAESAAREMEKANPDVPDADLKQVSSNIKIRLGERAE